MLYSGWQGKVSLGRHIYRYGQWGVMNIGHEMVTKYWNDYEG